MWTSPVAPNLRKVNSHKYQISSTNATQANIGPVRAIWFDRTWKRHWIQLPVELWNHNFNGAMHFTRLGRRKRLAARNYSPVESAATVDVIAQLESLDLESNEPSTLPADLAHRPSIPVRHAASTSNDFCLSTAGFGAMLALVVTVFILTVVSVAVMFTRRGKTMKLLKHTECQAKNLNANRAQFWQTWPISLSTSKFTNSA